MRNHAVFHPRIIALFLVTILIVWVGAFFLYTSFTRIKAQQDWVDHTYEVIRDVEAVASALESVQGAQRGYLITHYLDPYHEAKPEIEKNLRRLRHLITDNADQKARLQQLDHKVKQRVQLATDIIHTFDGEGREAGFAMVRAGSGKREMDEIVALSREMIGEEEVLLEERQNAVNRAVNMTLRLGGIGLLVCFALLTMAFRFMYREASQRSTTEHSLQTTLDQMRQISGENILMSRMAEYFQSCKSSEEAFSIIAANMPRLLPDTFGTVAVFSNSRNVIESKVFWGDTPCSAGDFMPDDCWALRRGRLHYTHPGGVEPQCAHVTCVPEGGYLCVPMQAHGETIGLFFIATHQAGSLDDHKRILARTVSEQISLALTNLKLQEKLRYQSIRDPMTGMFNRRYMEETLAREINRAQRDDTPLSVMMIDVDHFKRFNDTFGHDAGDALLIQFARLVAGKLRREDIACRYGGEEFLVIMPGHGLSESAQWAEELRIAAEQLHVELNGTSLGTITISMGIAVLPHHGDTPEHLVQNADKALYKAKQNGRNQVVVWA